MDGSFLSFFSILVCPIIAIYFIVMTFHGISDLIRLGKRDDDEVKFLITATKKQTRKYIIGAVIFSVLSLIPYIAKNL